MAIKVRIWYDTQLDAYTVSSSYSKAFVDGIKAFIPVGSRDYDPKSHFWYIKEQYVDIVRTMAEKAFGVGTVSFTSKQVSQQSQQYTNQYQQASPYQARQATPQQALLAEFVELIPYDALKRAYLLACQALHPDRPTGDAQKMSRLNQLWDRIEKEVYRR